MKIINEASDKFKDKQDEVCGFALDILRQINALENEVFNRSQELIRQKLAAGVPKHQVGPGENELWDEYAQRLGELLKPVCTDKLMKRGCGGSFGSPVKYGYIDGECTVNFIMKSAKKAVIETHFVKGTPQMHKFVLKPEDGKWLFDEVYYGFESAPDKSYIDSLR